MNYLKKDKESYIGDFDNRNSWTCGWCGVYTKRTYYKISKKDIRSDRYYYRKWCYYCPKCLR